MRPQLAIIGGGVSGICAAYLNQQKFDVVLFEKNNYLGGHTNTIVLEDGPDQGLGVDTGFIVCNNWTYPNFLKFLDRLGVKTRKSDMSFGFYCEKSGFTYAGTNLNGLFSQRRNIFSITFYKMITEIIRFNREGTSFLEIPDHSVTLRHFLESGKYSKHVIENYVLPLGAAIWSTPAAQMLEFPAITILQFFKNHGLLSLYKRPQWMSVVGGSHSYVKAFQSTFQGRVELNSEIIGIERPENSKPKLLFANGESRIFDLVIVAAHADQALKLLRDPSRDEISALGPWRYQENRTVLHTDTSVLPPLRRAWASWNYVRESIGNEKTHLSMTYHMNRLQGFRTKTQYCVSLNRFAPIKAECIIREFNYTHPIYTLDSLKTQPLLKRINGTRNTYYCGSYFGYGFHEDAVKSAVDVSRSLGSEL